jgi:hypothetical protein
VQALQVTGNPTRRLGHYVLGFGQDLAGEIYVLTSDEGGPTGTTGTRVPTRPPERVTRLLERLGAWA